VAERAVLGHRGGVVAALLTLRLTQPPLQSSNNIDLIERAAKVTTTKRTFPRLIFRRKILKMKRENPTIEICPGITRRTVANGKTMYQMIATLAVGSRMPEHRRAQEQIGHILEGQVRLIVDGVPHELFHPAIPSISPAMFRTAWKRYYRHACSIRSVRRAMITWRSMTKLAVTMRRSSRVGRQAFKPAAAPSAPTIYSA
jgi:hypothetical protein